MDKKIINVYIKTRGNWHVFTSKSIRDPIEVDKTLFYIGVKNTLVPLNYKNKDTLIQATTESAKIIFFDALFDGKVNINNAFLNPYSDGPNFFK